MDVKRGYMRKVWSPQEAPGGGVKRESMRKVLSPQEAPCGGVKRESMRKVSSPQEAPCGCEEGVYEEGLVSPRGTMWG